MLTKNHIQKTLFIGISREYLYIIWLPCSECSIYSKARKNENHEIHIFENMAVRSSGNQKNTHLFS